MSTPRRLSHRELLNHLQAQVSVLHRSAQAYDEGLEDEGRRLALTLRLLLHDTSRSTSLLSQLRVKQSLRYVDSAEPINPANLLPTLGLVMMEATAGGPGTGGGRYTPPLATLSPIRENPPKDVQSWWTDPVTKTSSHTYRRADYVLITANKEGGGHVDPEIDADLVAWTRENGAGWMYVSAEGEHDFEGNLGLASVRQIACEFDETIQPKLAQWLSS